MAKKKTQDFRYVTLIDTLLFDLWHTCDTCGQHLGFKRNVSLGNIVSESTMLFMNRMCTNCEGGGFRYPSFLAFNQIINQPFDVKCFRVMSDGHKLREAYENPCSDNICSCDRNINYLMISYSNQYPFICATCGKLFLYALIAQRKDHSYGFLRSIQINCFRDFGGMEIPLSDVMTYKPKF